MRVTTETWHLDRLGQLSEFEQDCDTNSEQESNTGGCARVQSGFTRLQRRDLIRQSSNCVQLKSSEVYSWKRFTFAT